MLPFVKLYPRFPAIRGLAARLKSMVKLVHRLHWQGRWFKPGLAERAISSPSFVADLKPAEALAEGKSFKDDLQQSAD